MIEPKVFEDQRGFFFKSFNHKKFEDDIGRMVTFVQDNHSEFSKGILGDLYDHLPPYAHSIHVCAVHDKAFDISEDVFKAAPTFGQWAAETLSDDSKKQLRISAGLAHDFLTMSDRAKFMYKPPNYYSSESERSLPWDDTDVDMNWHHSTTMTVSFKGEIKVKYFEAELFK